MSLSELPLKKRARIRRIRAKNEAIRSRLHALGVVKGERVRLLNHTLANQTFEIEAGDTRLALRKEEADSVEVEA
ncbi:FeoA family protein [Hydrogenimonas sp.]|uniref:FeoA family protein n=1 Tax=Hydrogenimonas sp. TaxID=2231112 RepID=UPI0026170B6F|nr:FeoA family protein [Hydrogenimonas sp.]